MAQNITREQKIRFMVWSVCMTGIIMGGSYLGATLKTERDLQRERKKIREAPVEEQVRILEAQKQHLNHLKDLIVDKQETYRERAAARRKQAEDDRRRVAEQARRKEEEKEMDRQREVMMTRRRAEAFSRQRAEQREQK